MGRWRREGSRHSEGANPKKVVDLARACPRGSQRGACAREAARPMQNLGLTQLSKLEKQFLTRPKTIPGTSTESSGYMYHSEVLKGGASRPPPSFLPEPDLRGEPISFAVQIVGVCLDEPAHVDRLRCWSPRASVRRCTSRCVSLPAAVPWSRGLVRRRRRTRPGPGPGRYRK
jgi:hypothetical protein